MEISSFVEHLPDVLVSSALSVMSDHFFRVFARKLTHDDRLALHLTIDKTQLTDAEEVNFHVVTYDPVSGRRISNIPLFLFDGNQLVSQKYVAISNENGEADFHWKFSRGQHKLCVSDNYCGS